jgi:hypothetical protein
LSVVAAGFVEVIDQFLFLVLFVADAEFEFALLGPEHDGLAVHAADHVEGGLEFAAQGQFQEVFLDAGFDGFAQSGLDLEEAVGGAKAFDALVRPLVVIVFDPDFDAFPGRVEAVELGAAQELRPDAFPEPLDLAQGHGVMGPAFEVGDVILLELGFEAAGAAPGGVLASVVGEHLLGRTELGRRHPIHFDHGLSGGAAEEVRADQEARVIVQEGDEVGVTAAQPEGEDVRLPHLVGGSPLEEARTGDVTGAMAWRRPHQLGFVQTRSDALGAGRQKEPPTQELGDPLHAKGGVPLLKLDDLAGDGLRQLGFSG